MMAPASRLTMLLLPLLVVPVVASFRCGESKESFTFAIALLIFSFSVEKVSLRSCTNSILEIPSLKAFQLNSIWEIKSETLEKR